MELRVRMAQGAFKIMERNAMRATIGGRVVPRVNEREEVGSAAARRAQITRQHPLTNTTTSSISHTHTQHVSPCITHSNKDTEREQGGGRVTEPQGAESADGT